MISDTSKLRRFQAARQRSQDTPKKTRPRSETKTRQISQDKKSSKAEASQTTPRLDPRSSLIDRSKTEDFNGRRLNDDAQQVLSKTANPKCLNGTYSHANHQVKCSKDAHDSFSRPICKTQTRQSARKTTLDDFLMAHQPRKFKEPRPSKTTSYALSVRRSTPSPARTDRASTCSS